MKRRRFSPRQRADLFLKAEGRCQICGSKITGRWEADHVIPLGLGGEDTVEQLQVACAACHASKTKVDVKRIAKAKRLHRTFVLGKKRKKRPIKSRGFDKRWRRRLDGTVERREAA